MRYALGSWDFALGSERVKKGGESGLANGVNKSLLALDKVVKARETVKPSYIPYRDSLLTRVTQVCTRAPAPPSASALRAAVL